MLESRPQGDGSPTSKENVYRRFLLRGLSVWPLVPAVLGGWWTKSSSLIVVRDGWVLSKDD
jgi:hypothetical protein